MDWKAKVLAALAAIILVPLALAALTLRANTPREGAFEPVAVEATVAAVREVKQVEEPTPVLNPLPALPQVEPVFGGGEGPDGVVPMAPPQGGEPGRGMDYVVAERYHLSCTENGGRHHIFIHVVDAKGAPLPGIKVRVKWPTGEHVLATDGNGYAEFPMYKGTYEVEVAEGKSQKATVTVDLPGDCPGNSLYHHSWRVVFRRRW